MWFKVNGIRVEYANNELLSQIRMEIPEGINVIIGPNGVGKSTLISIAEGLTKIDNQNNVLIGGYSPYKRSNKAFMEVAFLPEKPVPFGGSRVKDWIRLYGYLREIDKEKILKYLDIFDLNYLLNQNCNLLSMGETQLVSLIMCLSTKARYFVLDEPNANIDSVNRIRLAKELEEMKIKENASFLLTSHILDEILPIADNVIIFNKNGIVGPVSVRGSLERKFVLIKSMNNESLCRYLVGKIEYETNGHQVIIKNSNFPALLKLMNDQMLLEIISIQSFPHFLEGSFNLD
ncbi:MAG: ATP-binding cassette domain-containing protein [Thermoplasmataceae archaeon]